VVTAGAMPPVAGGATVDLADVQGNILRGYSKACVRHLVVCVSDLAGAVPGSPPRARVMRRQARASPKVATGLARPTRVSMWA
jgi:hypothetical protein